MLVVLLVLAISVEAACVVFAADVFAGFVICFDIDVAILVIVFVSGFTGVGGCVNATALPAAPVAGKITTGSVWQRTDTTSRAATLENALDGVVFTVFPSTIYLASRRRYSVLYELSGTASAKQGNLWCVLHLLISLDYCMRSHCDQSVDNIQIFSPYCNFPCDVQSTDI